MESVQQDGQVGGDWRSRGACLDVDPELFFPVGSTGAAAAQIEDAKRVCRRCVVVGVCLAWALGSREDFGVWGGLSEEERRAVLRREAQARRGVRVRAGVAA